MTKDCEKEVIVEEVIVEEAEGTCEPSACACCSCGCGSDEEETDEN